MQKRTAGPYGQRTKINYRRSIAQYIVVVNHIHHNKWYYFMPQKAGFVRIRAKKVSGCSAVNKIYSAPPPSITPPLDFCRIC